MPLRSLPTAARTRWRVQGGLLGALVGLVVAAAPTTLLLVLVGSPVGLLVPLLLLAVGVALGVMWANRRYGRFGYALTDAAVRVRDGVVIHSDAIAPLYRVQHVDISRGPLQLSFGLATLTIHTAAPAADIRLPDLRAQDADRVRDDILTASRTGSRGARGGGRRCRLTHLLPCRRPSGPSRGTHRPRRRPGHPGRHGNHLRRRATAAATSSSPAPRCTGTQRTWPPARGPTSAPPVQHGARDPTAAGAGR